MNTIKVQQYWTQAQYYWNKYVHWLDLERLLLGIAIFLAFLALRRVLTRFILRRLHHITKRTSTTLDDELLTALKGPVSWLPVLAGLALSLEYVSLQGAFETFIEKLLRSMGTILLFWALVNCVKPLAETLGGLHKLYSESMLEWLVRALRWLLIFLAGAVVLEMWGIRVGPILAGFGLLSVAVALGAQDLFKNLISGILVLMENWFDKGEWIKVDGVIEGTVERIGFRTTLIRRFDLAPVHVPNSLLADNALTNFSRMTRRRISWTISVTYQTTVDQLRQIRDELEAHILHSPDFAKPPLVSTFVRVDRFSDSSIDIMLYCFTQSTQWGEWLRVKEDLACKVKEIVEGAGASFAFPSRSVYLENTSSHNAETPPQAAESPDGEDQQDRPEPFTPPSG